MNVLLVTEPGVDGVFRYVESLADYLIGRGIAVHLAYSSRRGSDRLPHLAGRVRAAGGSTFNLGVANRPEASDLAALWGLRRMAADVRPDVIHSHSSKAGALARSLAFCGVRALQVYQPHAYVGMRPVRGRLDAAYDAVESILGRMGRTLVCSLGERAFALGRLRLPPDRVHLVSHGVDAVKFSPAAPDEKRRLRASLGLPEDAPILGFLGRSSAQKDPIVLYRAFARAAAGCPRLRLFHVGKGELDGELEKLAGELNLAGRIRRLSYLAAPADFYRAVDGFILTSRYEGLSLAALEALASDLPMILSEAPGNADMLALPLTHAWRAAPGDADGFARGIREWAEGLEHPRPSNHRALAQARFPNGRQFETVLGLYGQWISARRSAVRTGSPPP